MDAFDDNHKLVLKEYTRPVVHMRQQIKLNRFGLMFGAGLSRGFGLPTWEKLVEKLANDDEVQGASILAIARPRAGLPYLTEMLFEYFKQRRYTLIDRSEQNTRIVDYRIAADWRDIIRKHLYAGVSSALPEMLDNHPYFKQYLPLIRNTHMTVTYNFDDLIEQSVLEARLSSERNSRGCESITNPWTQFRRATAIIYHPNGVVPQNIMEAPSDRFVFSEASFAEQMMGIFAGDQAGLVNHLSKHTCLMIGLSLDDETLRSVLSQAARACPGNFHYYVHYMPPGISLDEEKKRAITVANFKVYNLVTLFLRDEGIRSLAELINQDTFEKDVFCDLAAELGIPVQFRFYITGPLGVGKSTTINHFRNLTVLDEWLEQRLPVLAKDWATLTPAEKETADNWIANQFKGKNEVLRREKEGIFLLDRGPVDPLAFTPESEWNTKAAKLLDTICPNGVHWRVEDGRVILFQGEGSELALRMLISQRKDYTAEKLTGMEKTLKKAYGSIGVTQVDARGLSPSEVARRLAEIVHLEPYDQICNLHERLEAIRKDGANVTM